MESMRKKSQGCVNQLHENVVDSEIVKADVWIVPASSCEMPHINDGLFA